MTVKQYIQEYADLFKDKEFRSVFATAVANALVGVGVGIVIANKFSLGVLTGLCLTIPAMVFIVARISTDRPR